MFDFLRRVRAGERLTSSLLSGEFDRSPIGIQLSSWFSERPQRNAQRQLFLQMALGLGGPRDVVASQLMDCITTAWRGEAQFGEILSRRLDSLVVFDPPRSDEQATLQRSAIESLVALKAKLCSLDVLS